MRDTKTHVQLQQDLVEHLWKKFRSRVVGFFNFRILVMQFKTFRILIIYFFIF